MSMANAFRSTSLVYKAIEKNEEHMSFMHSLWLDPQLYHQNNYVPLLKPINREAYDAVFEVKEPARLIDVLICLPIVTEDLGNQNQPSPNPDKTIPIGFINLHGITKENRHHRTGDIGILIAAEHQGKGYGSEAIRWVLNWAFQVAGLHRVGIESASFNPRAIRLWERLGFQHDGKDREALWSNGGWHDNIRLSILEGEWRAMVERQTNESDSVKSQQLI
jgi:GNAT superfamily N-acetyltransferase